MTTPIRGAALAGLLLLLSGSLQASAVEIIAGSLCAKAGSGVQAAFCPGSYDLLCALFSDPIGITGTVINTSVIEVTKADGTVVNPVCADLRPGAEPDERRGVLIAGNFGLPAGPVTVSVVKSLPIVGGEDANGISYRIEVPYEAGLTLVQASSLPLLEVANDGNGCRAMFPDSASVVRAVFNGGPRERKAVINGDAEGVIQILGMDQKTTTAAAERAKGMFTVKDNAGDIEILGLADIDLDNQVDVCVARTVGNGGRLGITCTGDRMVLNPVGNPCTAQEVEILDNFNGAASLAASLVAALTAAAAALALLAL